MKQKFIAIFFLIAFIAASATRPLVAAETPHLHRRDGDDGDFQSIR